MKKLSTIAILVSSSTLSMAAITAVTSVGVTTTATDPPTATPATVFLNSLVAAGDTYQAANLANGVTTGNPSLTFPNVDDFFLSTIVGNIGNQPTAGASLPVRTISFGGGNWTNTNGLLLDFFIFEAGATSGDAITVAAIFLDDSVGDNVSISGANWGNTGQLVGGLVQAAQFIQGTGFSITDLKDTVANGSGSLSESAVIKGIAITSGGGVDVAGVFAVVPEPSSAALAILGLGGLVVRRRRA